MATKGEVEALLKLRDEISSKLDAMATRVEKVEKRFGKGSGASKGFESSLGSLGSAATKAAGLVSALATGALAVFVVKSAQAASKAEETQNLFDVSFGDMASAAEDWAQRTQAAVGVNDTTLKNFAGTLFNMTTSMGLSREAALQLSTGFTELALDTSSFFNIPFDEAFNKIRSGLSGESEPLKQLGVLVTENTIKQTAFAQAILASGRQLTETEKVQARAIVIAQGLSNAAGDLIRTQDSWANQTRIVGESFVNLQETVGKFITNSSLLGNVIGQVNDAINALSGSLEENSSQWEGVVNQGLFLFLTTVERTIEVLGRLVRAVGNVAEIIFHFVNVLSLGILGITDTGKALLESTRIVQQFGADMESLAQKAGAGIDGMVDATGRGGESVDQMATHIADLRLKAEGLSDVLKTDLQKAITQGGTIPMDLWNKVVTAVGGNVETAQLVVGKYTQEIVANSSAVKANAGISAEHTKELAKEAKEIESLAAKLGTDGITGDMALLDKALVQLGGTQNLTTKGWQEVTKAIREYRDVNLELTPALAAAEAQQKLTLATAIARAQANVAMPLELERKEYVDLTTAVQTYAGEIDNSGNVIEKTAEKSRDWGGVMDGVNDILSEARGLMNLFGIDAESTAGKIINAFSSVFDTFNSILGIVGKIGGLFGGGGIGSLIGSVGGAGGGIAGVAGGGGGILGLLGIGGGGAAAAGGGGGAAAAAGGAAAGGIGIGALAATGYGAIAVAAIFAIRAALKKASAETTAEFLGIDFDVLSEGLQDTLQDMGKQTGDFSAALQMNLGQIFAEGGIGGIDQFAEKIADTFSFLERGQLDSAEAQSILNETVAQLLPQVDTLGAEGVRQLERLFAAAQQTGVGFEGMNELAAAYVQRANELGVAINNVALEALGLGDALNKSFAPETVEGIAEQFKLTNDQVRELAELAGVEVQTNLERMAAEAGLSVEQFRELADALGSQFGVGLEEIGPLLESLGTDAKGLAMSLGIDVAAGADGLDPALEAANSQLLRGDELSRSIAANLAAAAGNASAINFSGGAPNTPNIPGMQHGGFVPATPGGSLRRLGEGGEGEFVIPESRIGGGGGRMEVNVRIVTDPGVFLDENAAAKKWGPVVARSIKDNLGGAGTEVARKAGTANS